MKPWLLGACLVFGGAGLVAPDDEDTIEKVADDFYALQRKASLLQSKVKEDDIVPLIERCWTIYDQSEGEPAEFDALQQVLQLSSTVISPKLEQQWRDAAEKLFTGFLDDDRMASFVSYLPAPNKLKKEAESYVADLKTKSKSRAVKAAVAYGALQDPLNRSAEGSLDAAKEKELIAKLEAFAREFGAVKMTYGDQTYGESVKATIYAIENLKIGGTAPEIAAADLDGVPFKLSEYRGKAVMLDFWGYW